MADLTPIGKKQRDNLVDEEEISDEVFELEDMFRKTGRSSDQWNGLKFIGQLMIIIQKHAIIVNHALKI